MRRLEAVTDKFYAYGWLMPAVLPIADVIGRAAFNIVFYVYFIWAVLAGALLPKLKSRQWAIYCTMLLAFSLSVVYMPAGDNQLHSLEKFIKYAMHTAVFLITLRVLAEKSTNLDLLFNTLAKATLVTMAIIAVKFVVSAVTAYMHHADFDVYALTGRDSLPWLLPILIGVGMAKVKGLSRASKTWTGALVVLVMMVFESFVQARTALASILLGSGTFFLLRFRLKLVSILLAGVVLAALVFSLSPSLLRGASLQGGGWATLDKFTTGRSVLWRQAIETPPPSIWFGVGFSNVEGKSLVTKIQHEGGVEQVKHLHNFLLDCWYETGFLGLFAFLTWLAYHFVMVKKILRSEDDDIRSKGAILLSSSLSLLTFGMLSQGHASNFLSIYLFLVFAMMTHVASSLDKQAQV